MFATAHHTKRFSTEYLTGEEKILDSLRDHNPSQTADQIYFKRAANRDNVKKTELYY